MDLQIKSGDRVLFTVKKNLESNSSADQVDEATKLVGETGVVVVHDLETLPNGDLTSEFDLIAVGVFDEDKKAITDELGECLAHLLKPSGRLVIKKSWRDDCTGDRIISVLKLSGFVNVAETKDVVTASKPNYASGSSLPLKLKNEGAPRKVWQLDDDAEEELVDEEGLLDADDLKKPDPASLKVCGTTGKRKACANCSCGLADELEKAEIEDIKKNTQNAKSSCGSCYLGDAFRCAGCPYRGTPAFKPGEKVVIDTSSDI